MLEMLVVVTLTGVLAGIAYPSFVTHLLRARRADALLAVTAAQMAQERWRSNHAAYGSAGDLGIAALSANRHYSIEVLAPSPFGYSISAVANGSQRRDAGCSHLQLIVRGADAALASGSGPSLANAEGPNRLCWGR
jgi:type IV pilus assembly protein PilE